MSAVMTAGVDRKVAKARKGASGSSNRQRTAQVNLRLLPTEREQLEQQAADLGFTGSGQVAQYIRHVLALEPSATG